MYDQLDDLDSDLDTRTYIKQILELIRFHKILQNLDILHFLLVAD